MKRSTHSDHPDATAASAPKTGPRWLSPQVQNSLIVVLTVVALFNLTWLGLRVLVAQRMKTQYVETTGIVVDITTRPPERSDRQSYYYPVVEFQTSSGQPVVFKAKVGSPEPAYQPGQSVTVLYHRERPYVALLDTTRP